MKKGIRKVEVPSVVHVRQELEGVVFEDVVITLNGKVTKTIGPKESISKDLSVGINLDGEMVEVLKHAGANMMVVLQTIRERDDFAEVVELLNGSVIKLSEISDWTAKAKLPPMEPLGMFLLSLVDGEGKSIYTSRREVQSVLDDPVRRAKAEELRAKFVGVKI